MNTAKIIPVAGTGTKNLKHRYCTYLSNNWKYKSYKWNNKLCSRIRINCSDSDIQIRKKTSSWRERKKEMQNKTNYYPWEPFRSTILKKMTTKLLPGCCYCCWSCWYHHSCCQCCSCCCPCCCGCCQCYCFCCGGGGCCQCCSCSYCCCSCCQLL